MLFQEESHYNYPDNEVSLKTKHFLFTELACWLDYYFYAAYAVYIWTDGSRLKL